MILFVVSIFVVHPTTARADGIDLGLAGSYAVFGLGTVKMQTGDVLLINNSGQPAVIGDVAVGAGPTGASGPIGSATFQKGSITGSLYIDPQATVVKNNDFFISGTVYGNPPYVSGTDQTFTGTYQLDAAVDAAIAASAYYDSLAGAAIGDVTKTTNNTLSAGVYYTTNLNLNNDAVLTITGGVGDIFVLNVTGDFNVAKSTIVLQGGILASNVLFNVIGTGGIANISGDDSIFFGSLLAVNREIIISGTGSKVDGSGVFGRIIGALDQDLTIKSGALITYVPTNVSDGGTTLGLLGFAMLGLGYLRRRQA